MAVAALAPLIVAAFVSLAPWASRVAGAAVLTGVAAGLAKALDAVLSPDPATGIQGTADARTTTVRLIHDLSLEPAPGEVPLEEAHVLALLQADVLVRVTVAMATFMAQHYETVAEAQAAKSMLFMWMGQGVIPGPLFAQAMAALDAEIARITLGITVLGITEAPDLVKGLLPGPVFVSLPQIQDYLKSISAALAAGYITVEAAQAAAARAVDAYRVIQAQEVAPPVPPGPVPVPQPVPVPGEISPLVAQLTQALQASLAQIAASGVLTAEQIQSLTVSVARITTTAVAPPVAAPAPAAVNLAPITGALASLTSQVGVLPGALALALSNTAGPNAHAAQMARYGCQSGFLAPLLNVAGRLAPQLFLGTNLVLGGPIQEAFKHLMVAPIIDQLALDKIKPPTSEEEVRALAEQRLAQAIGLGMQAAGISYSLEAMTPLKNMGFGQLAGLLGEFAGFGRIANGLMGTVEDAAIYQPLRWQANRRFRPRLPSDQVLALMYQKRSLTRAELVDYLQRLGLDNTVIERTPGYIFNDPNPGLLIRAFQMAEPGAVEFSPEDLEIMGIAGIDPVDPDAYFQLKFAKSGLDPTDVKAFVPVVKMGILRREQTLRYGQIERLNREGMITRDRARTEIEAARVPTGVVDYRLAAMDLQLEYEHKVEFRGLVLAAYGREHLTAAEASVALVDAGFDGARVRMWMLSKQLGLTARGAAPEGISPGVDLALAEVPD